MQRNRLEKLVVKTIAMHSVVERMLRDSMTAVYKRDHIVANNLITNLEQLVNKMETDNERTFIEFLALFQPEAGDLRTVVSLLKINNNLERIADHTVNIVQRIPNFISVRQYRTLDLMFTTTRRMLRDSFDSMANHDTEQLKQIIARDAIIDENLKKLTNEVLESIGKCIAVSGDAISALLIGRDLERIADLTTNICEDIIYMLEGDIVKHAHSSNTAVGSKEN